MQNKIIKYTPILGELPENTEWFTAEDWAKHNEYVERLKKEGKYLTEGEEITLNFKNYKTFIDNKAKSNFSNFGIMIPKSYINGNK